MLAYDPISNNLTLNGVPVANAQHMFIDSVYVHGFMQNTPNAPRMLLKDSPRKQWDDVTSPTHYISCREQRTLYIGVYNEQTDTTTTVQTVNMHIGDLFCMGPFSHRRYSFGLGCKKRAKVNRTRK